MNRKEELLRNIIVLDTETTSLDKTKAEIIEIGYTMRFNNMWESYSHLYSASEHIKPETSAITNITQKMVNGKPLFVDSVDTDLNCILDVFRNSGAIVAHNADYDKGVLQRNGIKDSNIPYICTMRLAKKLFVNDLTVTQFNLPYLRYRFELEIPDTMSAHRADADTYMTALLFEKFVDHMVENNILDDSPYLPQIVEYMVSPVIMEIMPFGKYKGQKLVDIPITYWTWALDNMVTLKSDNPDYDPDFAASVEVALTKLLSELNENSEDQQ